MLGVLMCYLMIQMLLLEGLWDRKAQAEPEEQSEIEVIVHHKEAC